MGINVWLHNKLNTQKYQPLITNQCRFIISYNYFDFIGDRLNLSQEVRKS